MHSQHKESCRGSLCWPEYAFETAASPVIGNALTLMWWYCNDSQMISFGTVMRREAPVWKCIGYCTLGSVLKNNEMVNIVILIRWHAIWNKFMAADIHHQSWSLSSTISLADKIKTCPFGYNTYHATSSFCSRSPTASGIILLMCRD